MQRNNFYLKSILVIMMIITVPIYAKKKSWSSKAFSSALKYGVGMAKEDLAKGDESKIIQYYNKMERNINNQIGIVSGLDLNGDDFLSIRKTPKGEKIGEMHNGDEVKILDKQGKWFKIHSINTNKIGWSHSNWIKVQNNSLSQTYQIDYYRVIAEELNIRSEPRIDSRVLGTVKNGEMIHIKQFKGKWGESSRGWISSKYLVRLPNYEKRVSVAKSNLFTKEIDKEGGVATMIIQGDSEKCYVNMTYESGYEGNIIGTDCKQITNSKGIKILCTKNKKICKTTSEISSFLQEDINKPSEYSHINQSTQPSINIRQDIEYSKLKNGEKMGKYISYMRGDGGIGYITFEINGKEKVFTGVGFDEKTLEKHKKEFMILKYDSSNVYDSDILLDNIYFEDNTNANNEKSINAKLLQYKGKQNQVDYFVFNINNKESILSGYGIDTDLVIQNIGEIFHIVYTEKLDGSKNIQDISLGGEKAKKYFTSQDEIKEKTLQKNIYKETTQVLTGFPSGTYECQSLIGKTIYVLKSNGRAKKIEWDTVTERGNWLDDGDAALIITDDQVIERHGDKYMYGGILPCIKVQ